MDMDSFVLDFDKSPSFFKDGWNREFYVEDIKYDTFFMVLVDDICEDNFRDCIDDSGYLKSTFTGSHVLKLPCKLQCSDDGDSIIISVAETISYTLNSSFDMRGIFITAPSGYVMGYSINQYSVNINNQFIVESGLKLWSIVEGIVND